jgi:hypothetical protein
VGGLGLPEQPGTFDKMQPLVTRVLAAPLKVAFVEMKQWLDFWLNENCRADPAVARLSHAARSVTVCFFPDGTEFQSFTIVQSAAKPRVRARSTVILLAMTQKPK